MAYRFEFDSANKILRLLIEGPVTEELALEIHTAIRKHWTATNAKAGIWDCSSVTDVPIFTEHIRQMARHQPAIPEMANLPRIIVAPATANFGLSRMFQIVGEEKRPMLKTARSMDEALKELGVKSSHFEPLA